MVSGESVILVCDQNTTRSQATFHLLDSTFQMDNSTKCNCSNVYWSSTVTPYASKYAKPRIMTTHDKACLLSRTVTCWCWAKISDGTMSWMHLTALYSSLSDLTLMSQQSKLCIHLQGFWGHIGGESVMCLQYWRSVTSVITMTNILCVVLLWVSSIHVEERILYPYGSNKQLFCTSAMATPVLQ